MPSLNSMLLQPHAKHEEVAGTQVRSWSSGGGGEGFLLCFVDLGPLVQSPSGELSPLLPSAEPRVPGTGVMKTSQVVQTPPRDQLGESYQSLLSPKPL